MNLSHLLNFVSSLNLNDKDLENIKVCMSDVPCSGKDFVLVNKAYLVTDSSGDDFILFSGDDFFGADNE